MENIFFAAAAGVAGAAVFAFRRKLRIGHGWDLHVFGKSGKPLIIGGIKISEEIQIVANSDGDVVFHALTDAILGAAGFADIGEFFPNDDSSSIVFLQHALEVSTKAGWKLISADVTIILETPKLQSFKKEMAGNLKIILKCDVNVKAKSSEGVNAVGRGEAVEAVAVVLIEKNCF